MNLSDDERKLLEDLAQDLYSGSWLEPLEEDRELIPVLASKELVETNDSLFRITALGKSAIRKEDIDQEFMNLPVKLQTYETYDNCTKVVWYLGTIKELLQTLDIDDPEEMSETVQVLRHLRQVMREQNNVH